MTPDLLEKVKIEVASSGMIQTNSVRRIFAEIHFNTDKALFNRF